MRGCPVGWLLFNCNVCPLLCSEDEREEIIDKVYTAMSAEEKAAKDETADKAAGDSKDSAKGALNFPPFPVLSFICLSLLIQAPSSC